MADYLCRNGANVNRSSYSGAAEAALELLSLRERLCRMFGCERAELCIFMPGATFALNTVLKGSLSPGDHVIVSGMEHNAVMRPATELEALGIELSAARCATDGTLDPAEIKKLIKSNTKLVLTLHASNVCGTVLPIEQIGEICRDNGIAYCVDAAQSAGILPINMKKMHIDALAMPCHKGLLGPGGTGALLLEGEFAKKLRPLVTGGTGSRSDSFLQPEEMPDKFEAGTMNIPGVFGLNKALEYVENNQEAIYQHEKHLTERFIDGLATIKHLSVPGVSAFERVGVVSVNFIGADNAEAAFILESRYNIYTRCGLHCAPAAHKTLGTYPSGTVRFSFGHKNTQTEVDAALDAVAHVAEELC
jgi:cysteine desulfurase family protein